MNIVDPRRIREMRERTGLSVMACFRALREADGDVERAVARVSGQKPPSGPETSFEQGMRGRVVHTCKPSSVKGLSLMGEKTLTFTDHPAAYLHDKGGLIASEVTKSLEGDAVTAGADLVWRDRSHELHGQLRFESGCQAEFSIRGELAAEVAEKTFLDTHDSDPEAEFDYPIPSSVLGEFPEGEDPAAGLAEETIAKAARDDGGWSKDPSVWRAVLADGRLSARVTVHRGRLRISTGHGFVLGDAACRFMGFEVDRVETNAVVSGRMILAEQEILGLTICFPHAALADLFVRAATGALAAEGGGADESGEGREAGALAELVRVTGLGRDGAVLDDVSFDAVLTETGLSLDARDAGTVCTFDFQDPGTAIQGRSDAFLLCSADFGPISVTPRSALFSARLGGTAAVHAAAKRSARKGPHLGALPDASPVLARVDGDALRFEGPSAPSSVDLRTVTDIRVGYADDEAWLEVGGVRIIGQPVAVEGLALPIREGMLLCHGPSGVLDKCRGMVRLEEDYLLYTIVGPVIEIHEGLRNLLPGGDEDSPRFALREPVGTEEEVALLAGVAIGLERIYVSLDEVTQYLPGFLNGRDVRLMDAVGMEPSARPQRNERVYDEALGRLEAIRSRTARIEREVMRQNEARTAVAHASAVSAGTMARIGLGAAIGSPFMLLGAAGGLAKDLAAASERGGLAGETRRESAILAVRDWNHLVRVILPPVTRRVLDLLGSARKAFYEPLAQHLAGERGSGVVLSRMARLMNHPLFPDVPGGVPRGETIRRIRELLEEPPAASFPPF